jgi:hypothetical protein
MTSLLVDPTVPRDELYRALYAGDLALFSSVEAAARLAEHARSCLIELFAPYDPESVHEHLEPATVAEMLGRWKPAFIHDPHSKQLVREIIGELGFGPQVTYYDVPKPRTAFPVGHLSTGIALAFPWHRDTWYGAPSSQINWWLPVYATAPTNGLRFDLERFAEPVANNSGDFDYFQANRDRLTTAKQVKKETQVRPEAHDVVVDNPLVPVLQPGAALLFSGAHLHGSVPNTSGVARYSIDFRTVDRRHVEERIGASMDDVACTGTSIRDFVRVADGERIEEDVVGRIYGAPPEGAMVVFDAETARRAAEALDA